MSDIDMKCPKCGQDKAFNIVADVWGRYDDQGFDSHADGLPSYDNEFNEHNGCQCTECDWTGTVGDTQQPDPNQWAFLSSADGGLAVDLFPTKEEAESEALNWMAGYVDEKEEDLPDTLQKRWEFVQEAFGVLFSDNYEIQPLYPKEQDQ